MLQRPNPRQVHEGFQDDFTSVKDQVLADFAKVYAKYPNYECGCQPVVALH